MGKWMDGLVNQWLEITLLFLNRSSTNSYCYCGLSTTTSVGLATVVSQKTNGLPGPCNIHSLDCNRCDAAACSARASILSDKQTLQP
mmetsp:Transcript_65046/g.115771  ORF Transcript_65046/g.115771 Transcript_65046/m.115771 type:complete len:87 (-) Transcript_65046:405-665(-)